MSMHKREWAALRKAVGRNIQTQQYGALASRLQGFVGEIAGLNNALRTLNSADLNAQLDAVNDLRDQVEDKTRDFFAGSRRQQARQTQRQQQQQQQGVTSVAGGFTVTVHVQPEGVSSGVPVTPSIHHPPPIRHPPAQKQQLDRREEQVEVERGSEETSPTTPTQNIDAVLASMIATAVPSIKQTKQQMVDAGEKVKSVFNKQGAITNEQIAEELRKLDAVPKIRSIVQGKSLEQLLNKAIKGKVWREYQAQRRGVMTLPSSAKAARTMDPKAMKLQDSGDLFPSPVGMEGWYVSEKLDGVRAVWSGEGFFTKRGRDDRQGDVATAKISEINPPKWFIERMPNNMSLDGELYLGRNTFNQMNALRTDEHSPEWENVKYMVFDVPDSDATFEDRQELIKLAVSGPIVHIKHAVVRSAKDIIQKYINVKKQGGEGLVIRKPGSIYKRGTTSTAIKMKDITIEEAGAATRFVGDAKSTDFVRALTKQEKDNPNILRDNLNTPDTKPVILQSTTVVANPEKTVENEEFAATDHTQGEQPRDDSGKELTSMDQLQKAAMERDWPLWISIIPKDWRDAHLDRWYRDGKLLFDMSVSWPTKDTADALGFEWVARHEWEHGHERGPAGKGDKRRQKIRNDFKDGVLRWLSDETIKETKIDPWLWHRIYLWWSSKKGGLAGTKRKDTEELHKRVKFYSETSKKRGVELKHSDVSDVRMYHTAELQALRTYLLWSGRLRTRFHYTFDRLLDKKEKADIATRLPHRKGLLKMVGQTQQRRRTIFWGVWMAGQCWAEAERENGAEGFNYKMACAYYYFTQVAGLFNTPAHRRIVSTFEDDMGEGWQWASYRVWNSSDGSIKGMFAGPIKQYNEFYAGTATFDDFLTQRFNDGKAKALQAQSWVEEDKHRSRFEKFKRLKERLKAKLKVEGVDINDAHFKTGHFIKVMNFTLSLEELARFT